MDLNVFGEPLLSCCMDPITGFTRDGFCSFHDADQGSHWVCAQMTESFLAYSKSVGNDLSTPWPAYHFPGLKPGDFWCLCALRWKEAFLAGHAPLVKLEATSEHALGIIGLTTLVRFAYKPNQPKA
ncbi:MAG: DUF2237 family protein [Flavobacteriales bacterium]